MNYTHLFSTLFLTLAQTSSLLAKSVQCKNYFPLAPINMLICLKSYVENVSKTGSKNAILPETKTELLLCL